MSKKVNPTSIGLFIVIGVALGVIGLLTFSSSRLFSRGIECVLYFNSSLNGLNEGAPVKYRGVRIGSVKRVMIHFNQANNDWSMPVLVEIQENLLQERLQGTTLFTDKVTFERVVKRGLRGSLEAESMVTGVLYVNLDVVPDSPPPVFHELVPTYVEIPTRTTGIQELLANLAHVDFKGLEEKLSGLVVRIDSTLAMLQVGEIGHGVTNLVGSLNRLVVAPQITNTLDSIQSTLAEYRTLAVKLNAKIDPLADGTTNTLAEANLTLIQLRASVQDLGNMLAPDSPLRSDLSQALQQLADAAQSISALTEFLQRHPNAIITGRQTPDKKK
jgi:paraquat-inducible protein B